MAIYTETFNKADGLGLGPDLPWTDLVAGMRTVGGRATCTTGGTNAYSVMDTDLGTPDIKIEAVLEDFGNANYFDIQVMARVVDVNNFYAFMRGYNNNNGHFYNFRKRIEGNWIDNYTTGPTFSNGEVLRGEIIGNVATMYLNDVQLGSWAATEFSAQKIGLGAFRNGTQSTKNMFVETLTIETVESVSVPTGLVVSNRNTSSIELDWDAQAGVEYIVEREEYFGGTP